MLKAGLELNEVLLVALLCAWISKNSWKRGSDLQVKRHRMQNKAQEAGFDSKSRDSKPKYTLQRGWSTGIRDATTSRPCIPRFVGSWNIPARLEDDRAS